MTKIFLFVASFVCVVATAAIISPNYVFAQKADYKTRQYNDLVTELIEATQVTPYKFVRLRRAYSETYFYAPDAEDIINQMNTIAPHIKQHSLKPEDVRISDAFKLLMLRHLGNLDVVNNALLLSKTHSGILNTRQLETVLKGLITSLAADGDGKSFSTAYSLYTLGEEIALLRILGASLANKSIISHHGDDYAIFTVTRNNEQEKIYANISRIVKKIQETPLEGTRDTDIIGR